MATEQSTVTVPAPPVFKVPEATAAFAEKLTTADRVAFQQARVALTQAIETYHAAIQQANEERSKPERDFEAAKAAYKEATEKLTPLSEDAESKRSAVTNAAAAVAAPALANIDKRDTIKDTLAALQKAVDDFKASATAAVTQLQAVAAASDALRKLSETKDGGFNASDPKQSESSKILARSLYELAVAKAQLPVDAAFAAYTLKVAELEGNVARIAAGPAMKSVG